jgi:hypothetical protein
LRVSGERSKRDILVLEMLLVISAQCCALMEPEVREAWLGDLQTLVEVQGRVWSGRGSS